MNFKCPKCGSPYFTTVQMEVEPWVRQCRGKLEFYPGMGREYLGCSYTWLSTQDNKHGLDNDKDRQE